MDEPRERRLAAILARGLLRVRKCAERSSCGKLKDDKPPSVAAASTSGHQTTVVHAANQQGEPQ